MYPAEISKVFIRHKMKVLSVTLDKNGTRDLDLGLRVFFDPSEDYMVLRAIKPGKKANDKELSTGDGHAIISLSLEPSEIFTKIRSYKKNQ